VNCKIKTLGSCHGGDTTLSGGGVENVKRLFPDADVSERPLWDSIAAEPARLSGIALKLWSLRRAANRHPLYGEPSAGGKEWSFNGPYEMAGALEFDEAQEIESEATTEGLAKTANAVLHIARKEFEDVGAPDPKIGDVIEFWGDERSSFVRHYKYWEVTRANADGHIMSTPDFVQYRIELRLRTKFEPGRKVEGETT
jgi:hypothetical protein